MSKPKCPKCGTNEYVCLVKTFDAVKTAASVAAGAAAGSFIPIIGTAIGAGIGAGIGAILGGTAAKVVATKDVYKCNKCDCEFEADTD